MQYVNVEVSASQKPMHATSFLPRTTSDGTTYLNTAQCLTWSLHLFTTPHATIPSMHQQFNAQTETSHGHTYLRPVRPAPIESLQVPHTAGRSALVLMHGRSSGWGLVDSRMCRRRGFQ
jgi:hypothetical protein